MSLVLQKFKIFRNSISLLSAILVSLLSALVKHFQKQSVSGIIRTYFTNSDELTSNSRFSSMGLGLNNEEHPIGEVALNHHDVDIGTSSPLVDETPQQILHSRSLRESSFRTSGSVDNKKVGTRIVAASSNHGLSKSQQRTSLSLCKFMDGRSEESKSFTSVKGLSM